jgi:Uma2 family endonuclease
MPPAKVSVDQYLRGPESLRPMELVYGFVREPPAPAYRHQSIVTHLGALLDAHVRQHDLGRVSVSPVDVVLDREAALIVQPDVVFVSNARLGRIEDRIWGAPDLVVEVLSPRTARRDRTTKRRWYQRYGVIEYWLADSRRHTIDVLHLQARHAAGTCRYRGDAIMRSFVLPKWTMTPAQIFS